ncbi:hypothetical protein SADUNF_Sadunf17G0001100 [Salix dunnii]|uniref:Wall-associated receptor kinase galacturonan-binding domain-containing protein n=1 Tax=Salix dunnii TaxID=1413687 RepID=A0A835J5S6_9ROSI|nr:hypothetical protein SADUNF_Sadunf17G0001100 [Salix dunnii]
MFISRVSRHRFGAYAALLLLEILSTHHRCSARKSSNYCPPSSCGNILNISSPFRLNTDPGSGGHRFGKLACENNERLTLHLMMVKYYVEAINYSDSTIRLVDAAVQKDDCFSIPRHSLTEEEFPYLYFYYDNHIYYLIKKNWIESSVLAFICCENEIQNLPDYIKDTSSCKNGSGTSYISSPSCVNMEGHSFVMLDGEIKDVPDLCRVNLMYTVPKNVRNMLYTDVHNILADGFELSWSAYIPNLIEPYHSDCVGFTTPLVLLSFLMLFLAMTLAFINVESLRMPPKPFLTPSQVQEDDDRGNHAKLSDPPNDCSDSSYQFGR